MANLTSISGLAVVILAAASLTHAQDISREELRSLDEQVQEIKSDVLGIAAELNNLEERLLYPSGTQVAVFVAMEDGEPFRLDALQLLIDGELASHHIYSFKELEALQKGGVQRLYTGNVATGGHAISVRVSGKRSDGEDVEFEDEFRFDKGVEPLALALTVAGPGAGIRLGEW